MTGTRDWVTVVPGREAVKETVRELLALADAPSDVRTQGNGDEFLIPPYLADRYQASLAPAPKRRSRTKKEDES